MEDCNTKITTPATTTPLGMDLNGDPFKEKWDYACIIGMLMYLSANTRADISYAVHQAARFTHKPCNSHAVAIKRILRYLKRTQDKGMFMRPSKDETVDCYVDADFAGLYGVEHDQDPTCVKSRTGYILFYRNCPILWVSKLQTQIALSTMESEYIALSQSMRDLIPIREILKQIALHVFDVGNTQIRYTTKSSTFKDVADHEQVQLIPQSKFHEDNDACLKFARMPKLTPRTKHIGIPYHWFRTKIINSEINVLPIDTTAQLRDVFTKGLIEEKFVLAHKAIMGWWVDWEGESQYRHSWVASMSISIYSD